MKLLSLCTATILALSVGAFAPANARAAPVAPAVTETGEWNPIGPAATGGLLAAAGGRVYVAHAGLSALSSKSTHDQHQWETNRTLPSESSIVGLWANSAGVVVALTNQRLQDLQGFRGELFRSEDAGNTWKSIRVWDTGGFGLAANGDGSRLVVRSTDGLSVSKDGGVSWNEIQRGWPNQVPPMGSDLLALDGDQIYFVATAPSTGIWTVKSAFGKNPKASLLYTTDQRVSQIYARDGVVAATARNELHVSRDGKSFKQVLKPETQFLIAPRIIAGKLYVSSDSYVYLSSDFGRSWETRPVPSAGEHITDMVRDPDTGDLYASSPYRGTYKVLKDTFSHIGVPGLTVNQVLEVNGSIVAAGIFDVFSAKLSPAVTIDSWRRWDTELLHEMPVLAASPSNPSRIWHASRNGYQIDLWRSDDGGANWEKVGESLPGRLAAFKVDPSNAERMVLATTNTYTQLGAIYVTDDGGQNWTEAEAPDARSISLSPTGRITLAGKEGVWTFDNESLEWRSLRENPANLVLEIDNRLILTEGRRLLVSNDGGESFSVVLDDLESTISSVVIDDDLWFVGLSSGDAPALASKDGAKSWSTLPPLSLSDSGVRSLTLSSDKSKLWAATSGSGVQEFHVTR